MAAEKILEDKVKRLIRERGYYCEKIHGSEYQSGVSDLIACVQGRYVGLEVKAPNGRLSPLQKQKLRQVRKSGGIGEGVWGIEIVRQILDSIEVGKEWQHVTDISYIESDEKNN